jgi:hypothetical protein
MSYRLRMSAEIGDWLTELGSSEGGVAAEVGAALAAAMDAVDVMGLALVTNLSEPHAVEPGDRVAAVDAAYQDLLAWLQLLRREAAEAGSMATASRQRITPAGSWPEPWTDDEIAQGHRREAELIARSQRWQRRVDAFRIRKEAVKARYTAASAARDIQRAIIASAQPVGRVGLELRGQPEVRDTSEAEAELAAAERELTTASAEVGDLLAESARLRHGILGGLSDDDRTPDSLAGVTGGLLEVRACPFAADVRLLCAVEPAGTLTLLAVLEGEPAISSHLARAIGLAGELLAEIRSDGWPADIGEVAFADTATFLHKSFPHLGSYISARSAELAAATTIAGLRRRRGLSLADIAAATGLSESALWKLETTDLRSARIDDVAGYVQALGGNLELTAVADHGAPDGSAAIILY